MNRYSHIFTIVILLLIIGVLFHFSSLMGQNENTDNPAISKEAFNRDSIKVASLSPQKSGLLISEIEHLDLKKSIEPYSPPLPVDKKNLPINYSTAEEILKNLYSIYGNRQRPCPKILIVDDTNGPRYRESGKTIVLNEVALEVCRSFGKDSLNALAFIIGHELAHFFQQEAGGGNAEFSYLAYSKNIESDPEKERLADIQGIFNAYLAGYRTTHILADLIGKLYKSHNLPSQLEDYPPLEERQQASAFVLATIDTLTNLHEAANYLTALGQYELAAASYEYILQYYPGREIYNNLGACYALHAMHCSEKSPDLLLYPIEIDTESRLKKPKARGGESELSEGERNLRKRLLAQAEYHLETAGKMDHTYVPVDINLLCVYTLQGKGKEAIQYFKNQHFLQDSRFTQLEKDKARLAYANALANSDLLADKKRAERIFKSIGESEPTTSLALMATYNLKSLNDNIPTQHAAIEYDCPLPFEVFKVDGMYIHRNIPVQSASLRADGQLKFSLSKKPSSCFIQFYKSNKSLFNLQIISGSESRSSTPTPSFVDKQPQIINTSTGFFLICEQEHAAFLYANGKLKEWGRYYSFQK